MTQIQNIPLAKIEPDPDQPRKYFDEQKLNELAETIKVHGVIVPITLRPHSNAKKREAGHFLLDTGERRWRASEIAGLTEIPAIVQAEGEQIDAGHVLERQLIENTQRADLSPLEEGETYRRLKEGFAVPLEELMSRTGKSRSQIYARIALTKLPPAVKKAVGEGKLTSAIAELAATIGDAKLQEQFARECLGEKADALRSLGIQAEGVSKDLDTWEQVRQPLSYRAAKELLRRKYSTRLSLAKFDTSDETLTKAGACGSCVYRSGAQLELGVKGASVGADDVCVKTSCFEEKTAATWKRAADAAKAAGVEVVPAKHTKEIFSGAHVRGNSPYVDLETELPYELMKSPGKPQTYGKLLGKKAAEIPRVLVQDETGAPREMIDKSAAVKVLRELGKIDKPEKRESSSSKKTKSLTPEQIEKQRIAREAKEAVTEGAMTRMLEQAAAGGAKELGSKETAVWRWLAKCVLDLINMGEGVDLMLARRGLKDKELHDAVDKAKTANDVRALVVEMIVCDQVKGVHGDYGYASKETKELFADATKLFGLDWSKAVKAAKEAQAAEAASLKASEDAKAEKKKGGAK